MESPCIANKMSKNWIILIALLAFFFSIETKTTLAEYPYDITLNEKTEFPIVTNGKTIGAIVATNGVQALALSESNGLVEVKYLAYTTTISKDKTNLDEVIEASNKEEEEKKASKQERSKKEKELQFAKQQQQNVLEQEKVFKNAQRIVRILNKYINTYPIEEQNVLKEVIKYNDDLVSKYSNSTPEQRLDLVKEFKRKNLECINTRPIYGFKYNEFLHRYTVTPVDFNIYKNNDGMYILVGDGQFCTVADIKPSEFGKFFDAANSFIRWSDQCADENLNVEKELLRTDTITMEFVSQDNADNQFIRVSVKGPLSRSSILASQDIIMTKMNFFALVSKMTKAGQMLQNGINAQKNADKLK